MKLGTIFPHQGESWEVVEVLDPETGIYTIRKLFDTSCKSDKLFVA